MDAKPSDRREPLVRLVGWSAGCAAIAVAGTGPSVANAAPGDLDPAFGEVGRAVDLAPVNQQLWSLETRDDESIQFAGGGAEYCGWYYSSCDVFETLGRLDAFGEPDTTFVAGNLASTYVYDTTLLDDGRLVGTGYSRGSRGQERLTVFRLLPNGALDTTFGLTGQVMLAGGNGSDTGHSVLVEDDGGIVVAGTRGGQLMVARFLANGSPDAAFGTQGVFHLGTQVSGPARLASAPGGGYRALANLATAAGTRCSIVGVTSNGAQDAAFGDGGVLPAPVSTPGPTYCSSFAALPGGDMLVAGNSASGAYVARILANGSADPAFDPAPVAGRLGDVSALAVGTSGKIFVAGPDGAELPGARIVRLLASGAVDQAFGQGGATTVDAKSPRAGPLIVRDMQVRANDALVLAGNGNWQTPVVARLLGDVGQSGPGVLGMVDASSFHTEQDGHTVVRVRRTGGAAGNVGVSFVARAVDGGGATAGQDFTAVTGELSWAAGDTGEREITVPIADDAAEERPERFEIVLQSPTGGAGLGAMGVDVDIAGSSYPHGDFAFTTDQQEGQEGGALGIAVYRLYYGEGPVSVEVRLSGGDAEPNTDFTIVGAGASNTVVLTWDDDEYGIKGFNVNLLRDSADELSETIEFELGSPTGGALVAAPSRTTMRILDATPAPGNDFGGDGNRGSGAFAGMEALLLALLAGLRRRWGHARRS